MEHIFEIYDWGYGATFEIAIKEQNWTTKLEAYLLQDGYTMANNGYCDKDGDICFIYIKKVF